MIDIKPGDVIYVIKPGTGSQWVKARVEVVRLGGVSIRDEEGDTYFVSYHSCRKERPSD